MNYAAECFREAGNVLPQQGVKASSLSIRNGSLHMRHGVKEGDLVWSMSDDVKEAMKPPA